MEGHLKRKLEEDEERNNGGKRAFCPKVGMIISQKLVSAVSMIDKVGLRPFLTHSLIRSYDLMTRVTPLPLVPATRDDLEVFHSRDYLDLLYKEGDQEEDEEYGLGYDCPRLPSLFSWCCIVAGGSISAAQALVDNKVNIAINWEGGWHHAFRDKASGFCYVNDVVLAIHRLQQRFSRILYIDLDVHHGDGVEAAFSSTDKVATLSMHKFEPGFFPGTGALQDQGSGKGKGYSINLPLGEGLTDSMFLETFTSVFQPLMKAFEPESIVVQCGADCLALDPMGGFALTLAGPMAAVSEIASSGLPLLLLGGGGYVPQNAARLWTQLTALVSGAPATVGYFSYVYK